jgi:hypothetical protein
MTISCQLHRCRPGIRPPTLAVPQLPDGCFGTFTIARVPPLWFAPMDARLVAAVHSDASRIDFHPRRRAAPMRRRVLSMSPRMISVREAFLG